MAFDAVYISNLGLLGLKEGYAVNLKLNKYAVNWIMFHL